MKNKLPYLLDFPILDDACFYIETTQEIFPDLKADYLDKLDCGCYLMILWEKGKKPTKNKIKEMIKKEGFDLKEKSEWK